MFVSSAFWFVFNHWDSLCKREHEHCIGEGTGDEACYQEKAIVEPTKVSKHLHDGVADSMLFVVDFTKAELDWEILECEVFAISLAFSLNGSRHTFIVIFPCFLHSQVVSSVIVGCDKPEFIVLESEGTE